MASEVTSDLGIEIELSDLNNLCSHVSLAYNCYYLLNLAGKKEKAEYDPLTLFLRPR